MASPAPEVVFDRRVTTGPEPALGPARVLAVRIPDAAEEAEALGRGVLLAEEREYAAGLPPMRRGTWIGGRVAARMALADLGADAGPIFSNDRGAPLFPDGTAGSISHKRHIAVALVARRTEGYWGVDLEIDAPGKVDIATRVLTPAEQRELAALGDETRAHEVLLRFSAKEAIYKGLDPYVRRYVGFQEVAVQPEVGGHARVIADLSQGEGPFTFDVRWERFDGVILTTAHVVRA